jgi:AraC-like DNA-binding protein
VGAGWQRVFGSFKGAGYSVEWHDFEAKRQIDWGASFHPDCIELCLNLSGCGVIQDNGIRAEFNAGTAGFYRREEAPVSAVRLPGERHQFLTVEFSRSFLAEHLAGTENKLHPVVKAAVTSTTNPQSLSRVDRLTIAQEQILASLRQPPVYAAAQNIWYQCKVLELAVACFYQPPPEEEFFCTRQQRLDHERAEQVVFLLMQNLANPPALEELAKRIGCSSSYLSRLFSSQTGQTITQSLRRLRMEKAAEMLRSKEYSVTEVALEVGYNSLSHFSQAFHETYGCCPGLYPLSTLPRPKSPA